MPYITKEQIKDAIFAIEHGISDDDCAAAVFMLQGLLDQPEDDGSDWFYKLQFICRALQGVSPGKTDLQTALGMAQSLRADRWKAEMALLPITSDAVTDEMLDDYLANSTSRNTTREMLAAAANAYMGAKK